MLISTLLIAHNINHIIYKHNGMLTIVTDIGKIYFFDKSNSLIYEEFVKYKLYQYYKNIHYIVISSRFVEGVHYTAINLHNGKKTYFNGNKPQLVNKNYFLVSNFDIDAGYNDNEILIYKINKNSLVLDYSKIFSFYCGSKNFKRINDKRIIFDLVCEEENASITNYILNLKDNRWVLKNQKKIK